MIRLWLKKIWIQKENLYGTKYLLEFKKFLLVPEYEDFCILGLGVYGEVYKFIKLHYFTEQSHDFNGGDLETQRENTATENDFIMARFIKIRGFELITETFPCGALQLYILIL